MGDDIASGTPVSSLPRPAGMGALPCSSNTGAALVVKGNYTCGSSPFTTTVTVCTRGDAVNRSTDCESCMTLPMNGEPVYPRSTVLPCTLQSSCGHDW